jgi:hypothetical protein
MREKQSDDLQLFINGACRPAGACRLNRQMQRKRTQFAQPHIDPCSVFQKTMDRHRTSRPNRTMKGSGPALIRMIDFRPMLNQKINERTLRLGIPDPAGVRPGVAGVM